MDRQQINFMIAEMHDLINKYAEEKYLFCGGCCYAAAVLAKYLEKVGIRYDVLIYQYSQNLKVNDFNTAINGKGVAHVAIQVVHKHRRTIIGDVDGVREYFRTIEQQYVVRRYRKITPSMLLTGYIDGVHNARWNSAYDKTYNNALWADINHIYMKYAEI